MILPTALFLLCVAFAFQVNSAPINEPDPPNGTCLYDGLTIGVPYDPTAYFVCCARYWLIKYCVEGEVFDKFNLTCVASEDFAAPLQTFSEISL